MANNCTISRVKINNDSKGNVEKALSVIGNDVQRDVIALHINIGLFKHWLVKNRHLTQNSDIYDTNVNTLKSWIRKYNDFINNSVVKPIRHFLVMLMSPCTFSVCTILWE